MNHLIAKVMFFLTGGQSGFAFPLSHQWHGINVAPPLYLIAFAGALLAIGLLGYCVWRKVNGRPSVIAFLAMLLSATAAYAASSTLANLSAASAISAGDLFYVVQSGGDFKATGTQLQTWAGTVVNVGAGGSGGPCLPGTSCTLNVTDQHYSLSANAIVSTDWGGTVDLNSATDTVPTIAEAGTTGFLSWWFTNVCNIGSNSQTITPGGGTIGGASTFLLAAGSAASPVCVQLTSDGVSNYKLSNLSNAGGGGTPGGSNTQVQYNNSSAFGGISGVTSGGTGMTAAAGALNAWGLGGSPAYYKSGNWMLPFITQSISASGALVASTIYCHYGTVTAPVTIKKLGTYVALGESGGKMQFAIYSENGSTGGTAGTLTLIDDTGDVTATSNATAINGTVGNTTDNLIPGVLYAWCSNSTASSTNVTVAAITSANGNAAYQASVIGSATQSAVSSSTPTFAGRSISETYGTWPGTITESSMSDVVTALVPPISFQVN